MMGKKNKEGKENLKRHMNFISKVKNIKEIVCVFWGGWDNDSDPPKWQLLIYTQKNCLEIVAAYFF